jgi:hypothetical protein
MRGEALPFHVLGRAGGTISDCSSFPGAPFCGHRIKKFKTYKKGFCMQLSSSILLLFTSRRKRKAETLPPPPPGGNPGQDRQKGPSLKFHIIPAEGLQASSQGFDPHHGHCHRVAIQRTVYLHVLIAVCTSIDLGIPRYLAYRQPGRALTLSMGTDFYRTDDIKLEI